MAGKQHPNLVNMLTFLLCRRWLVILEKNPLHAVTGYTTHVSVTDTLLCYNSCIPIAQR